MYCEFFGFTEKPFAITPNPRFIFLSKNHREAFAHLIFGVNNHAGFIELTGEVGTGKTTVLRSFLGQLDETHRTALIFNPALSALELLRSINREFGIPSEGLGNAELLEALYRFLLAENRAGRTVVLVIDEAQNLAPEVLEQVRLISNLETETDKLIQIILAGQPELAHLLARPSLRQIAQRITVRYHLPPLDFEDTQAYIAHRLELAGGWRAATFTPAALRRIFRFSGGIPRLVNVLCDRALLVAFTGESREVTERMVRQAIGEISRQNSHRQRYRSVGVAMSILGLIALALALFIYLRQEPNSSISAHPTPSSALPPPVNRGYSSLPTASTHMLLAFKAIARLWHLPEITTSKTESFQNMARSIGMELATVSAAPHQLRRLDLPFIAELPARKNADHQLLTVTGMKGDRLDLAVAAPSGHPQTLTELAAMPGVRFLIPWQNFENIKVSLAPGQQGVEVIRLQMLLIQSGWYKKEPNGIFDRETTLAVRGFQNAHGLKPSGRVGAQTLILIYRSTKRYDMPTLKATEKRSSS